MIFKLTVNYHLIFGSKFMIVCINVRNGIFFEKIHEHFAFYDLFKIKD